MSITPSTPNLQSMKSFWDRKEGTTGKIVLIIIAAAAGLGVFMFLPVILAFINAILLGGIEAIISGSILFALIAILSSKQFRFMVGNGFKLIMRKLTGLFITIDPIGILREYVNDMKKKKVELDENISNVAGVKKSLETNIDNKKADVVKQSRMRDEAHRQAGPVQQAMASTPQDNPNYIELQLKLQSLTLSAQGFEQKAGFDIDSIKQLSAMLDQVNRIYTALRRYSQLADFQITTTSQRVDILAEQRKSILAASRALNSAKGILKGDPTQLAVIDQTLEFLADDTAKKLGDMDDFDKWSQSYLSNMDIEKGAMAADGAAKLDEFEAKLKAAPLTIPSLGAGSSLPAINMLPNAHGVYEAVPVKIQTATDSAYNDLFK
jgi:hypothetical protein